VGLEERVEADLSLGRHAGLVPELGTLIAEHPFRERLRRQLMLALYAAGRQADALDAYQQARRTFVDELGIEPSPALAELQRAILDHDVALSAPRPSVPLAPAPSPGMAERRQTVTVLFADVVRSTRLARALDPEALREVMARYFAVVRRIVERHGGIVEKFIGDAVMGLFGVPRIHEDDALRAVRAATSIHEALAALNRELSEGWGVEIEVRIGVNTGEVVAGGAHALLATGEAVNVAKRLEEAAGPGEVLVGEATWRLVRDAVDANPVELDRDAHDVEGAWRVSGVSEGPAFRRRLETPIVGRERELAQLREAFDEALANDHAQLVTLLGPAGIGKTRLSLELAARVADEATVLTGHCPAFGEALTYWPLNELLEAVGERAGGVGSVLGSGRSEEVPPATRALLEELARERPLVVVLEDLHWAEPTFLDLVDYLARWVRGPVLLLCVARTEFLEDRPEWADANPGAATLTLEPLSSEETEALVATMLGTATVHEDARRRLIEGAEGNPLFIEQLLSSLLLGEAAELPPTIEALLAARLDRLGPGERAVLEVAAVSGREFTLAAVSELLPPEGRRSVNRHTASLVRRDLVRPLRVTGDADTFAFRHILVRETAYRSTPKGRREKLHRDLADQLERQDPDVIELIGYHLEQAYLLRTALHPVDGGARRLAARAGDRLSDAGVRAWKRGDVPAAINLLGRATSLLPEDSRRRELLCELGLAMRSAGELGPAQDLLERTAETANAAGDRRLELRALIELTDLRLSSDRNVTADDLIGLVQSAIPVLAGAGDDRSLGRAWLLAGLAHGAHHCQHRAWQVAAERALVCYERAGWPASTCVGNVAAALYHGPIPASEAIRRCKSLSDHVREREPRHAGVLLIVAGLEAMRDRIDEARAIFEQARGTYEELGQLVRATEITAWAKAQIELFAGDLATAEVVLAESCARFEEMGIRAPLATAAADLADVLYQQGRDDEAERWGRVSERHARSDDVSAQFLWRCVRAKILARRGQFEAADALTREALALVEQTDALNRHAKTLLDRAEVLRLGGQFAEAVIPVEQALGLYERKENHVGARSARRLLAEPAKA